MSYKIKPYELDKSIRLARSKLDKPFVTINALARASVVSSAIKQNKEYLSTIIDPGFIDVAPTYWISQQMQYKELKRRTV